MDIMELMAELTFERKLDIFLYVWFYTPPPPIKSLQFIVEFRYINFGEQHYSVILMWLHDMVQILQMLWSKALVSYAKGKIRPMR